MAVMREVLISWTVPNGGGASNSVLHFSDLQTPDQMMTRIRTALEAIKIYLGGGVTATVVPTGRLIDSETGLLVGLWSGTPLAVTGGTASGSTVPNQAQVLLRLSTDVIRRGRYVKGRIFIPGFSAGQIVGGEVSAGARDALTTAFSAWTGAGGIYVYSRPTDGTSSDPEPQPGFAATVQTVSVWNEFAVQRRRRN